MDHSPERLELLDASKLRSIYRNHSKRLKILGERFDAELAKRKVIDLLIKKKTGTRQSWIDEQAELTKERLRAGELRQQGKTIKEIAAIMQIGIGQAFSRVKQWKKHHFTAR
jgi:hypothetical protein